MARFRLTTTAAAGNRTGQHVIPQPDGKPSKVIRPGEVIESDKPLDKLFRNKFERLGGDVTEPEPEAKPKARRRLR